MYICRDCGSLFSTPEGTKSGKWVCPDCGSRNYTEAEYCELCHTYFIADGYATYCPDCINLAEEQLREAILQRVDPDFIKLLRAEYDDLDYIMGDGGGLEEPFQGGPELPEEHA